MGERSEDKAGKPFVISSDCGVSFVGHVQTGKFFFFFIRKHGSMEKEDQTQSVRGGAAVPPLKYY